MTGSKKEEIKSENSVSSSSTSTSTPSLGNHARDRSIRLVVAQCITRLCRSNGVIEYPPLVRNADLWLSIFTFDIHIIVDFSLRNRFFFFLLYSTLLCLFSFSTLLFLFFSLIFLYFILFIFHLIYEQYLFFHLFFFKCLCVFFFQFLETIKAISKHTIAISDNINEFEVILKEISSLPFHQK